MTKDLVRIYHAEGRRSFRIVWLCEELGVPYEIIFKPGDLLASMETVREIMPLMPMFPVVEFQGQVIVESGAILQLLEARLGNGRLVPKVDSPDFALHLQWLHFAEGTAMYRLWARRFAAISAQVPIGRIPDSAGLVGLKSVFDFIESYLAMHKYFGGAEFTTADIMMHLFSRVAKLAGGFDPINYTHVVAWRDRVESRPAFQRALSHSVPGGANEYGLPKNWPLIFDDLPEGPAPMPEIRASRA